MRSAPVRLSLILLKDGSMPKDAVMTSPGLNAALICRKVPVFAVPALTCRPSSQAHLRVQEQSELYCEVTAVVACRTSGWPFSSTIDVAAAQPGMRGERER